MTPGTGMHTKPYKGILFLDVDGVLNSEAWFKSEEYKKRRLTLRNGTTEHTVNFSAAQIANEKQDLDYHISVLRDTHIDPVALENLNWMLEKANLAIVLSSTWRLSDLTRNALSQIGIDHYQERLQGITPFMRGVRGNEIQQWIDQNEFKGKFCILDDDGDMEHLGVYLIQTSWKDGLTRSIARSIVELFE